MFLSAYSTDYYVNKYLGDDNYNGLYSTHSGGLNGPKQRIQAAINTCSANDKIFVSPGLYTEYLNITFQLSLLGSGSGSDTNSNTIVQSPSTGNGTGINIQFPGSPPLHFTNISDIRIQQFRYGAVMAEKVSYYNVVVSNNFKYGFWNGPNISFRDIIMTNCQIINNGSAGIYVGHSCNIVAWMIDSCDISDNTYAGIYIFCDNPATANIIDFLLRNSTFRRNKHKGVYAEKLHNCLFENLLFDSCGIDTTYAWNAGIDINLKYGNYANLTISGCEFIHCGTGGNQQAGCGMTIKARDDGSVYGANPATLNNPKIVGNKFHYCQNGLVFGEPLKNNAGPTQVLLQENKLAYNHTVNLVSHIQADIAAHNNCWLTTHGPFPNDTLKTNTGDILTYTWIKDITDQTSRIGFQSDSIVWFNKVYGKLQNALDVTPSAWTLFISDSNYSQSYFARGMMNIYPDQYVTISSLHFNKLSYIELIHNDLYISDSLFIHREAYFNTGNQAVELSDSGIILEDSGYVLFGKIRTSRLLGGNPDVENFGGIGLRLTARISQSFPQNNVILIRTTGPASLFSFKQVLRTYDVFAHKKCNWDAELEFSYDISETYNLFTDSNLILMKSYNNGIDWLLTGGDVNTMKQSVTLKHVGNISGLWTMIDSSGTIEPAGLTINSKIDHCSCPGMDDGKIEITMVGGYKPYSYLWSDGSKTQLIDSLFSGSYWVTVSDTHACSITDTFNVKQPDPISSHFSVKDVSCFGGADGEVMLIPQGGTPPYQLNWSFGDTSYFQSNLTAKTYSLSITDSNFCIHHDSVIVDEPDSIQVFADVRNVSCFGKNNGRLFISVWGGTMPYQFFWAHGSKTDSLYNLKKGTYYLSVLDSNLCIQSDTFIIEQPDVLQIAFITEDVKCFGDSSGSIKAMVSGGTTPYIYAWNDLDSTASRSHLMQGFYKLQVVDSNHCTDSDSVLINQPDPLQLSFFVVNDTNNKCIGEVEALVSGGFSPYNYQWDDPNLQQSARANGLCSGIYIIDVLDSNSCEIDSSMEVLNIINESIYLNGKNNYHLYPNPFQDHLIISSEDFIREILIYDLSAQLIKRIYINAKKAEVKLSELKAGSYLFKAIGDKTVYTQLIIKE